jgi:hypothetical protein
MTVIFHSMLLLVDQQAHSTSERDTHANLLKRSSPGLFGDLPNTGRLELQTSFP